MITVAMVYRSGGDFAGDYVVRLADQIDRHLNSRCWTVCLTDRPSPAIERAVDEVKLLEHNWPGWWAKLELFGLDGPVLYLDLDTIVRANIEQLAAAVESLLPGDVMMLRGFYRPIACSGILGWNGSLRWLLDRFAQRESLHPKTMRGVERAAQFAVRLGLTNDQEYVADALLRSGKYRIVYAQDLFPGIYSYKVHIRPALSLPTDAAVICFHGRPRPHEVDTAALEVCL